MLSFNEGNPYTNPPLTREGVAMGRPRKRIEERFFKFVSEKPTGCHEWTSTLGRGGYGKFFVPGQGQVPAHRVAYEISVGQIPRGLLVLHTCDNPKCVNPKHLYIGDHQDNARDMVRRGRHWGRRLLKDADVRKILKMLKEGKLSQEKIAARFGVSQITVSRIKLGQRLYLRNLKSNSKENHT